MTPISYIKTAILLVKWKYKWSQNYRCRTCISITEQYSRIVNGIGALHNRRNAGIVRDLLNTWSSHGNHAEGFWIVWLGEGWRDEVNALSSQIVVGYGGGDAIGVGTTQWMRYKAIGIGWVQVGNANSDRRGGCMLLLQRFKAHMEYSTWRVSFDRSFRPYRLESLGDG